VYDSERISEVALLNTIHEFVIRLFRVNYSRACLEFKISQISFIVDLITRQIQPLFQALEENSLVAIYFGL
jgi:hypothetical protein